MLGEWRCSSTQPLFSHTVVFAWRHLMLYLPTETGQKPSTYRDCSLLWNETKGSPTTASFHCVRLVCLCSSRVHFRVMCTFSCRQAWCVSFRFCHLGTSVIILGKLMTEIWKCFPGMNQAINSLWHISHCPLCFKGNFTHYLAHLSSTSINIFWWMTNIKFILTFSQGWEYKGRVFTLVLTHLPNGQPLFFLFFCNLSGMYTSTRNCYSFSSC